VTWVCHGDAGAVCVLLNPVVGCSVCERKATHKRGWVVKLSHPLVGVRVEAITGTVPDPT